MVVKLLGQVCGRCSYRARRVCVESIGFECYFGLGWKAGGCHEMVCWVEHYLVFGERSGFRLRMVVKHPGQVCGSCSRRMWGVCVGSVESEY